MGRTSKGVIGTWKEIEGMEAVRVNETWQRAGVYYVRTQAMVKGFQIPLAAEFDERDTPDTKYILVLDDIYPIATCRLHITGEDTAKIERVALLEEYRKKGIGRFLIQEAESWLKDLGIKKVIITSRDEAVGFYEALGYKADYSKVEDGGIFTIIYTEKEL